MKPKPKTPTRISPDQFGLDELVIDGAFVHVERMDRGHMWMRFSNGEEEIDLNFHAKKGTIEVQVIHAKNPPRGRNVVMAMLDDAQDLLPVKKKRR